MRKARARGRPHARAAPLERTTRDDHRRARRARGGRASAPPAPSRPSRATATRRSRRASARRSTTRSCTASRATGCSPRATSSRSTAARSSTAGTATPRSRSPVGEPSAEAAELMRVTEEALWRGIAAARQGGRVTDISHAVETLRPQPGRLRHRGGLHRPRDRLRDAHAAERAELRQAGARTSADPGTRAGGRAYGCRRKCGECSPRRRLDGGNRKMARSLRTSSTPSPSPNAAPGCSPRSTAARSAWRRWVSRTAGTDRALGRLAGTAFLAAALAAPSAAAAPAPGPAYRETTPERFVVAISVDGLNPDAIRELGPERAPSFHRLLDDGAGTLNARTAVEMSVTLPNHTGMLTGRRIERKSGHHVDFNEDNHSDVHTEAGAYRAQPLRRRARPRRANRALRLEGEVRALRPLVGRRPRRRGPRRPRPRQGQDRPVRGGDAGDGCR